MNNDALGITKCKDLEKSKCHCSCWNCWNKRRNRQDEDREIDILKIKTNESGVSKIRSQSFHPCFAELGTEKEKIKDGRLFMCCCY